MRTTLDIDDDILSVARELAESQGVSIGKAMSQLARKGLDAPQPKRRIRNGVPLLEPVPGAPKPTLELINRLRDEL